MVEMKKYYLPPSLQSLDLAAKVSAFEGVAQLGQAELLYRPYASQQIYRSLRDYANFIRESGEFNSRLEKFLPADTKLEPDKFKLLTHDGFGPDKRQPYGPFYYDSTANLILYYGEPLNGLGVTAGIDLIGNRRFYGEMDISGLEDDDLIINQLQGPTNKPNPEVCKTFENFRWEKLMSGFFVNWSRQAGVKNLFFLPSEFSPWTCIRENRNKTAFWRYDVTAQRMGFRRQNEKQPYKLDIGKSWKDTFEVIVKER